VRNEIISSHRDLLGIPILELSLIAFGSSILQLDVAMAMICQSADSEGFVLQATASEEPNSFRSKYTDSCNSHCLPLADAGTNGPKQAVVEHGRVRNA
jgi:hypothetical protein